MSTRDDAPEARELRPGDSLGRFTIEAVVGQGGMGRVYRARDTTLERAVAIKLLPPTLLQNRELERRFEREAQLLASLNHPNVATLYDFVGDAQPPFLAMELVEGRSLAEILREEGALAPRRALEITAQVAAGLAAAHEAGVIHRDIKPENLQLTPEGRVKVLDFGLARAQADVAPSADTEAPTAFLPTRPGTVMGTAPYMSPEQARGLELDERTDLWSLGCVLFELLTGRRAFPGSTATDAMAAVLQQEPDWSLLPADLTPAVARLLRRLLYKEPNGRLRSAGDLRIALDDLLADLSAERSGYESSPATAGAEAAASAPAERPPGSVRRPRGGMLVAGVAGLLLGALVTGLALLRSPDTEAGPGVRRLSVPLAGTLEDNGRPAMALSPDGRHLAYIASGEEGQREIWLRPVDGFEARRLGVSAYSLFWSPDGRWIGFADAAGGAALRRIPIEGGPSERILEIIDFSGADWADDGSVVLVDNRGLLRVEPGGELDVLVDSAARYRWPQDLGDGSLLVTRQEEWGDLSIVHRSADGDETLLVRHAFFGRVVRGERLLYARSGSIYVADFDASSLAVGEPRLLLDQVATTDIFGSAAVSVSRDGTLAWVPAEGGAGRSLMAIDIDGRVEELIGETGAFYMPRASPDGRFVAFSVLRDGDYDLWRLDVERGIAAPWITDGSSAGLVWSPDGSRVVYANWSEEAGLLVERSIGDGRERVLYTFEQNAVGYPVSWGSDGRILVSMFRFGASENIYLLDPNGGGDLSPLLDTDRSEQAAVLSPDGRLLAWAEDAALLVASTTDLASAIPIADEGRMPRWSLDGRSLFYLAGQRSSRLMEVEVRVPEGAARPRISEPRELFDHEFGGSIGFGLHRYDVLPDGRFVFASPDLAPLPVVNVHVGWLEEIEESDATP